MTENAIRTYHNSTSPFLFFLIHNILLRKAVKKKKEEKKRKKVEGAKVIYFNY